LNKAGGFGLATPPGSAAGFDAFGDDVLQSDRIRSLLGPGLITSS